MKQTLSTLKVIVLALVLGLGISYAQAVWTGPTAAPTGGNVAAPLNVGATAQIKTGDLKVNNLEMSGATATSGTTLTTSGSTWAYGALDIKGSKGGYSGINFKNSDGTNAGALVMKSDGYAGFFNTSLVNNWSFIVYPNIAASPGAVRIPGLAASPAALGKVLTAVNASGDATWQTPATAVSVRPTVTYVDNTINLPNFNITSGSSPYSSVLLTGTNIVGGGQVPTTSTTPNSTGAASYTFVKTYSTTGIKTGTVTVTDNTGNTNPKSCPPVTVLVNPNTNEF